MNGIVHPDEVEGRKMDEGVEMKVLAYGEKLMMTYVKFKKGAVAKIHSHEHEQMSYIVEGEFIYTVGDEEYHVRKGHSIHVPSNVPHGVRALTDGILVDVFTPIRSDFL